MKKTLALFIAGGLTAAVIFSIAYSKNLTAYAAMKPEQPAAPVMQNAASHNAEDYEEMRKQCEKMMSEPDSSQPPAAGKLS